MNLLKMLNFFPCSLGGWVKGNLKEAMMFSCKRAERRSNTSTCENKGARREVRKGTGVKGARCTVPIILTKALSTSRQFIPPPVSNQGRRISLKSKYTQRF